MPGRDNFVRPIRISPRNAGVVNTPLFATLRMLLQWTVVWLSLVGGVYRAAAAESFDIVIKGGRIVDGTGAPWYAADVGIRKGKIAKIGRLDATSGQRTIDATGLIVAPGFIDMMGQTATPMAAEPGSAINLLTQGITTINAGEGVSAAPLDEEEGKQKGWRTMTEYFRWLERKGLPLNVAQTIGHTQVRLIVLGEADRRASDAEMERMKGLVREAMEAGAIGVSTALIYPPAVYAPTQEIAGLAEVAGQYGGRYYTHMRNEGDKLEEAIDEALEIGRAGKTPVHIFHLKTAGRQNWGKMQLAIAKIKAARAAGQQVTADIYPYVNNGLGIAAFIHPRHFSEGDQRLIRRLDDAKLRAEIRTEMETTGGWENWYRHVGQDWGKVVIGRTAEPRYAPLVGQSVAEIAKACNEEPWDTFFNLVRGRCLCPSGEHDGGEQDCRDAAAVRFVLHRRRAGRRLLDCIAPAGVWRFSAAAFALCARSGSDYVRKSRGAGERRRSEQRPGLRPGPDCGGTGCGRDRV